MPGAVPLPVLDGDTLVGSGGIFVPASQLAPSTFIPANRIASGLGVGRSVKASLIADAVASGLLILAGTFGGNVTATFQNANHTVAGLELAQTFIADQAVQSANGMTVRAAALQDGIALKGRAGGVSGYVVTIIPQSLTASRTHQLIDADLILAGSAAALTSGRVPVAAAGGLLSDSTSLTFNGTDFAIGAGIGAPRCIVNGAAGSARFYNVRTAGSTRWQWGAETTPESGSDAGSAFQLSAYTDAAGPIDNPLTITRAAGGALTLARPTVIAQGTITAAALGLSGTVTWNSGATSFRGWQLNVTDTASAAASSLIDLQLGGATRFQVLKTGEVGLSVAPTAGAGLLQLSAGTTIANGIAMNGCGIFANAANSLTINASTSITANGPFSCSNVYATTNSGALTSSTTSTLTSSTNYSIYGFMSAQPGSASSATYVGMYGLVLSNNVNLSGSFIVGCSGEGRIIGAAVGPLSKITGLQALVSNQSTAGVVTFAVGVSVLSAVNSGGGSITTNVGLDIGAQTVGGSNFAIRTSTGLVSFGDTTNSTSSITGGLIIACGLGIGDGKDIGIGTATGTKIGQATSKLGFYGKTPVTTPAVPTYAAITTTATAGGAYTATEQGMLASLKADVIALRAMVVLLTNKLDQTAGSPGLFSGTAA